MQHHPREVMKSLKDNETREIKKKMLIYTEQASLRWKELIKEKDF